MRMRQKKVKKLSKKLLNRLENTSEGQLKVLYVMYGHEPGENTSGLVGGRAGMAQTNVHRLLSNMEDKYEEQREPLVESLTRDECIDYHQEKGTKRGSYLWRLTELGERFSMHMKHRGYLKAGPPTIFQKVVTAAQHGKGLTLSHEDVANLAKLAELCERSTLDGENFDENVVPLPEVS